MHLRVDDEAQTGFSCFNGANRIGCHCNLKRDLVVPSWCRHLVYQAQSLIAALLAPDDWVRPAASAPHVDRCQEVPRLSALRCLETPLLRIQTIVLKLGCKASITLNGSRTLKMRASDLPECAIHGGQYAWELARGGGAVQYLGQALGSARLAHRRLSNQLPQARSCNTRNDDIACFRVHQQMSTNIDGHGVPRGVRIVDRIAVHIRKPIVRLGVPRLGHECVRLEEPPQSRCRKRIGGADSHSGRCSSTAASPRRAQARRSDRQAKLIGAPDVPTPN